MKVCRFSRRAIKAFTLVELLVVLLIVGVLMSFAFGWFRSVRASAATVQCVQNLKHLYTSTLAFVEDRNGLLPPDLGGDRKDVDPWFSVNQYWWEQAYLGPYTSGKLNRKRDTAGAITEVEARCYRCPARLQDGPDSDWVQSSNGKLSVSYVMLKRGSSRGNYLFRNIENKSKKLYITEGRGHTLARGENATTGAFGVKGGGRLRRYHNGAFNILFLDGHVHLFNGTDGELVPFLEIRSDL